MYKQTYMFLVLIRQSPAYYTAATYDVPAGKLLERLLCNDKHFMKWGSAQRQPSTAMEHVTTGLLASSSTTP